MGSQCSRADSYVFEDGDGEASAEHTARVPVNCLAYSAGDDLIMGLDERLVVRGGSAFAGHRGGISALAWHGAAGVALTGSRDLSLGIWRVGQADPVRLIEAHSLTVSAVAPISSASQLASGSRDTTVALWDLDSGKCAWREGLPRNLVTCLTQIPGEAPLLAQGAEDLHVRVWDCRARSVAQAIGGYTYFPLDVDVSVDGVTLLTGSKGFNGAGGEARLIDLRTGKVLDVFRGHDQDATCCRFLRSGRFATASKDGTVKLWSSLSSAPVAEWSEPGSLLLCSMAVSEEGRVSVGSFAGRLYDLEVQKDSIACVGQMQTDPVDPGETAALPGGEGVGS